MDDTQKMLRAIINGQSAMKSELLTKIESVDNKVDSLDKKVNDLDKKIDKVEKNLTGRIDKIGLQLANLEDDAPTRDEHDDLEKRVEKVEQTIASA
jgi:chromosome segregation ATPase